MRGVKVLLKYILEILSKGREIVIHSTKIKKMSKLKLFLKKLKLFGFKTKRTGSESLLHPATIKMEKKPD